MSYVKITSARFVGGSLDEQVRDFPANKGALVVYYNPVPLPPAELSTMLDSCFVKTPACDYEHYHLTCIKARGQIFGWFYRHESISDEELIHKVYSPAESEIVYVGSPNKPETGNTY